MLRFFGIEESQLVTILANLIDYQTDPTLAPACQDRRSDLAFVYKSSQSEKADQRTGHLENQILDRQTFENFFERCYGYGEETSLAECHS